MGGVTGQMTALTVGTVGTSGAASVTGTTVALDVGWSTNSGGIDTTGVYGSIWSAGTTTFPSFFGSMVLGLGTSLTANAPANCNYVLDIQQIGINASGRSRSTIQPVIGMVAASVAPASPAAGRQGWSGFWYGSAHNTYWVVAYNNAGTMEYKYIPVNGTLPLGRTPTRYPHKKKGNMDMSYTVPYQAAR